MGHQLGGLSQVPDVDLLEKSSLSTGGTATAIKGNPIMNQTQPSKKVEVELMLKETCLQVWRYQPVPDSFFW